MLKCQRFCFHLRGIIRFQILCQKCTASWMLFFGYMNSWAVEEKGLHSVVCGILWVCPWPFKPSCFLEDLVTLRSCSSGCVPSLEIHKSDHESWIPLQMVMWWHCLVQDLSVYPRLVRNFSLLNAGLTCVSRRIWLLLSSFGGFLVCFYFPAKYFTLN